MGVEQEVAQGATADAGGRAEQDDAEEIHAATSGGERARDGGRRGAEKRHEVEHGMGPEGLDAHGR